MRSLLVGMLILLISCNEDTKETATSNSSEKINLKESAKKVNEETATTPKFDYKKEHAAHLERLQALDPLSISNVTAWFPQSISDMTRDRIKEGRTGAKNMLAARAYYSKGTQKLDIEVVDGASENGSMIVSNALAQQHMRSASMSNATYDNKKVDHNGMIANQTFNKKYNSTTLMFVTGERFHITVRSEKMEPEATWKYVDLIDFSTLD